MMIIPDDDFELHYKCHECNKKQNVKPGLIWDYGTGKDFNFDNEIMCKFCFSNNINIMYWFSYSTTCRLYSH